jgi:hypothetical protein
MTTTEQPPDKPIIINPDGTPVDLNLAEDEVISTANIVPATATRELASPQQLRTIYTETWLRRIRGELEGGEGVIALMGITAAGLAISGFTLLVLDVIALAQMISANITVILTVLVLLMFIPVLLSKKRGPRTLTLKGCPKGPTPGAHTIRLY